MRWWLEDVENAIYRARQKIAPVADSVAKELNIGKHDDLFIVGGFVRDNVLAELTNKETDSKDLDLILPKRPDFDNNPNILWKKENSMGGIKIGTKKFPEIDIFQPSANDVQMMVGEYFDFTCNALYYSHRQKQIFSSFYFYCFTSGRTIQFENFIYTDNGIGQRYTNESMISRALKFQVMFREKFGMETKLSPEILYILYTMDKDTEQKMFEYTKLKVKNQELQNNIINEYKKLRSH